MLHNGSVMATKPLMEVVLQLGDHLFAHIEACQLVCSLLTGQMLWLPSQQLTSQGGVSLDELTMTPITS